MVMSVSNATEVVELVRHLRHGYLNHLQVITGYLELGMPERAHSYIKGILSDADRERELLTIQPATLGLVLYQLYLHWRVQGIVLLFTVHEPLGEWAAARLPVVIEKLLAEQNWRPNDEDDLWLQVVLAPEDNGRILITITETVSGNMTQTHLTRE